MCLDLEFLDRVHGRIDDAAVDVAGRVGRAVDQNLLRTRASAADVEIRLEEVASDIVAAAVAEVGAEGDAGRQGDEGDWVADVEGQILDGSGGDDGA